MRVGRVGVSSAWSVPREMLTHQGQTGRDGRLGCVIPRRHRHQDLPVLAPLQGQHRHQRAQPQQDGGGVCEGPIRPLPWRRHAEMGPSFFTGHLDGPAPDDPRPELHGCGPRIGTDAGLHAQFPLWVRHQPSANVERGQAGVYPRAVCEKPPKGCRGPLYQSTRKHCENGFLEIIQAQASRETDAANLDIELFFDFAIELSIKPGDARATSIAFSKLLQDMFDAWLQLETRWRPGLSMLVRELPARQLHGIWPLVLRMRARDYRG